MATFSFPSLHSVLLAPSPPCRPLQLRLPWEGGFRDPEQVEGPAFGLMSTNPVQPQAWPLGAPHFLPPGFGFPVPGVLGLVTPVWSLRSCPGSKLKVWTALQDGLCFCPCPCISQHSCPEAPKRDSFRSAFCCGIPDFSLCLQFATWGRISFKTLWGSNGHSRAR